jgi:hypothetical protein
VVAGATFRSDMSSECTPKLVEKNGATSPEERTSNPSNAARTGRAKRPSRNSAISQVCGDPPTVVSGRLRISHRSMRGKAGPLPGRCLAPRNLTESP